MLGILREYGLCYIASPYTKYQRGIDLAFADVAAFTMSLHKLGIRAFSPIVYSHALATELGIDPLDHEFWMAFDKPFMDKADALIVARFDGWQISQGVTAEIALFQKIGKPVWHVDPFNMLFI